MTISATSFRSFCSFGRFSLLQTQPFSGVLVNESGTESFMRLRISNVFPTRRTLASERGFAAILILDSSLRGGNGTISVALHASFNLRLV